MRHTLGSPLNITTDNGIARFKSADGAQWAYPLIGWATTVSWNNYEGRLAPTPAEADEEETSLEAVILVDHRYPRTIHAYLSFDAAIDVELVGIELTR